MKIRFYSSFAGSSAGLKAPKITFSPFIVFTFNWCVFSLTFLPAIILDAVGTALTVVGILEVGHPTGYLLPDMSLRVEFAWAMIVIGIILFAPILFVGIRYGKEKKREEKQEEDKIEVH